MPECATLSMNPKEVTGINSKGIKTWLSWLGALKATKIEMTECPVALVKAFNSVFGALPAKIHLKSFYVPFYSDDLDEERHLLYTEGVNYKDGKVTSHIDPKTALGPTFALDAHPTYFKVIDPPKG